MTEKLAKGLRIATIPPVLVTLLLSLLYASGLGIINGMHGLLFGIIFLALIPASAYPLSTVIPSVRARGRDGQRRLAFVTSISGYTLGTLYAFSAGVSDEYRTLFITYLVSVIILTFFNKILKIRASGHACGTFGPMLPTVYFLGWQWLFPCAAICAGVIWSSLHLARHTKSELFFGALCSVSSFVICSIIIL